MVCRFIIIVFLINLFFCYYYYMYYYYYYYKNTHCMFQFDCFFFFSMLPVYATYFVKFIITLLLLISNV